MHFDSKPFRQTFGAEYIYLFDGMWQREDLFENSNPFEIIVLAFVNYFGAALQQHELPPRKLRIPPFPNFSFQITLTRESILLIFGQSASTSLRYARYINDASQPEPTLESVIAECEGSLGWENCLGISFSPVILTNQTQRDEELKKEADRIAMQFADQLTRREVVNNKLINLPLKQNRSINGGHLMAVEVFLCYAHKDERLLNNLKTHLKPMLREEFIALWYDRDISAGTKWEQKIDEHLNTAQIILLLISANFMASDYCYSIEMKRALERHERGEARTIPIILRPTDWQNTPLGGLQALPKDGKPIITWRPRDNAYLDVAKGLRNAIEETSKRSTASVSIGKQTVPEGQGYWSKEKERIHTDHTRGIDEEVLAKLREELEDRMQRQREADNLLLEARKFASGLIEKDELVKKAVDLWPPYKQRELRQLGIEMSITVIDDYDPVTQRGIMVAGLGRGMSGYIKLERHEIAKLATTAIDYLQKNILETTMPDADDLLYLACMYGYQQQFEDMIRIIKQAIKADETIKKKFRQRKILQMLLRACASDQIKLEELRMRLDVPLFSKKAFCKFLQDFDLTGFNGFIEWIAIKRPSALGEKGTFLIKITPPYPSNEGKVSASAQSMKPWDFETVISNVKPVTIEELYEALHSLFILFCPIE